MGMSDPLVIHESTHWLWKIHTNQAHLGHMVFIARRTTEGSLSDCSQEEWADLQDQIARYEEIMAQLFAPDRFNYTQFGNEWAQLHVHAFPRYRTAANWRDKTYADEQRGSAPSPEAPSTLEGEELQAFADCFRDELHARN